MPHYSLSLADGTRWLIRAGDPEASRVVAALGAAMQLRSAPPCPCGASPPEIGGGARGGRELLVTVGQGKTPPANLSGPGPAVCTLSPLFSDDMLNINVSHLALVIAREAQSREGVLLHGALAEAPPMHSATAGRVAVSEAARIETQGAGPAGPLGFDTLRYSTGACSSGSGLGGPGGILLAGPGTMGKSTASNRLPPLWRALCDDATLVVRDPAGQYWAHPWPTWSRFYTANGAPGPGGSWDVQRAVSLRAVFFLSQSPEDRAEPLGVTPATAMLMEAVQHVSRPMTRHLPDDETQALYQEQLAAVSALAQAIPTYTLHLHLSLTGAFWEEIERVIRKDEDGRQLKDEGGGMKDETSPFILHPSSFVPHPSWCIPAPV